VQLSLATYIWELPSPPQARDPGERHSDSAFLRHSLKCAGKKKKKKKKERKKVHSTHILK
jgi:hypothetical protein